MESVHIIIIAVVVGVFGTLLLGGLIYLGLSFLNRKSGHLRQRKIVVAPMEERVAASSVGGNLVREETIVPITDVYIASKVVLGRGSSAQVVVGENIKTKRRYAIKIIDNTKKEVLLRYEKEKYFLKDIDHTNVVRLYEVYSGKQSMHFVMELCTGGHLGMKELYLLSLIFLRCAVCKH